jgi:membrane protease YdiL (CAAX protease family)
MNLNPLDHLIVVLLALVIPILDHYSIRKRVARIRRGETGLRMRFYRHVLIWEWAAVALLLTLWLVLDRGVSTLGLTVETGWLVWLGYGLTVLVCVSIVMQGRSILAKAEHRESLRKEIGWMVHLMPHTLRERNAFDAVSITAGICEEIIYRGYLTLYLMTLFGIPFWAAAVGSTVIFGVGHIYQGPKGAMRAAAGGAVMAALYGMTGALWAPIVVHAVMDLTAGRTTYATLNEGAPEDKSPQLAAYSSRAE